MRSVTKLIKINSYGLKTARTKCTTTPASPLGN